MAKIDQEGLEKLRHVRNALNAMFDKLDAAGAFNNVQQEFQYMAEILEEAKNDWEKV